jgi:hypothetical protein
VQVYKIWYHNPEGRNPHFQSRHRNLQLQETYLFSLVEYNSVRIDVTEILT